MKNLALLFLMIALIAKQFNGEPFINNAADFKFSDKSNPFKLDPVLAFSRSKTLGFSPPTNSSVANETTSISGISIFKITSSTNIEYSDGINGPVTVLASSPSKTVRFSPPSSPQPNSPVTDETISFYGILITV
uniref:Secreted protein n=1 Tax=Caenorhabditis tropicalis TaxID=1561998 RepID=A0A1I7T890_9PELO